MNQAQSRGVDLHDVAGGALRHQPAQHRTKRHTTNPPERVNEESQANVVWIPPNEASIIRLIGAVLPVTHGRLTNGHLFPNPFSTTLTDLTQNHPRQGERIGSI